MQIKFHNFSDHPLYQDKVIYFLFYLTTPGKQFSVSRFGPSSAAGVDPPDESDEESGDDGMELFNGAIFAVINCNEI